MRHENEREPKKRDGDVQPGEEEVTAAPLTKRLADLADRAGEKFRLARVRSVKTARATLDCGAILVEARAECPHGAWGPFLKRADIADRTASRLMRVFKSGIDAETLAGKGIRLVDEEMSRSKKSATEADSEPDAVPGAAFRAMILKLKVNVEKGVPQGVPVPVHALITLFLELDAVAEKGRRKGLSAGDVAALLSKLDAAAERPGHCFIPHHPLAVGMWEWRFARDKKVAALSGNGG